MLSLGIRITEIPHGQKPHMNCQESSGVFWQRGWCLSSSFRWLKKRSTQLVFKTNVNNMLVSPADFINKLLVFAEHGDAHEWLRGLANPRHPQRHQPANAQGEEPDRRALYEGGTGKEAGRQAKKQPQSPVTLSNTVASQQPLVCVQKGEVCVFA